MNLRVGVRVAGKTFSDLVNKLRVDGKPVVISRSGDEVAVLVKLPGAAGVEYEVVELPRSAVISDGPAECQFWEVRPAKSFRFTASAEEGMAHIYLTRHGVLVTTACGKEMNVPVYDELPEFWGVCPACRAATEASGEAHGFHPLEPVRPTGGAE